MTRLVLMFLFYSIFPKLQKLRSCKQSKSRLEISFRCQFCIGDCEGRNLLFLNVSQNIYHRRDSEKLSAHIVLQSLLRLVSEFYERSRLLLSFPRSVVHNLSSIRQLLSKVTSFRLQQLIAAAFLH